MSDVSVFTVHRVTIPIDKIGEPIYLIPWGDVHWGTPLHDSEKFDEFINKVRLYKNAYFLGMGDLFDFSSSSERKSFCTAQLHDSTLQTIDQMIMEQCEKFANKISFMKGKIIGLIEGNHYSVFSSTGITTTQKLCEILKCKYLGVSSFIRLSFLHKNKRASIDIWAHHGKGASKQVGTSLNRVSDMLQMAQSDIYLCGHDHKKSVGMVSQLRLNSTGDKVALSNHKIILCRTGSFMRGYVPDEPSYVAKGLLSPTDLGAPTITMIPRRDQRNGSDTFYIDLTASL